MQAPTQITPAGLSDYLDVITRAVFQSGMSWRVVEAKWAGFREAFAGFDPAVVAAYTDDDVERRAGGHGDCPCRYLAREALRFGFGRSGRRIQ